MFGFSFGFEGKVKSVLKEKFNYEPGSFQLPILKEIAAEAKRQSLNEFDAAIMFMMVQMNSLTPGNEDCKTFVRTHSRNVESVLSLARSPYSDIVNMLSAIKANHGLTDVAVNKTSSAADGSIHATFEDWLDEFKRICASLNPQLKLNEKGRSFVDFVEHEPLRRAFRDGIAPMRVAREFASNFDINSFGRR
jgi:hypothetical protein